MNGMGKKCYRVYCSRFWDPEIATTKMVTLVLLTEMIDHDLPDLDRKGQ